MAPVIGCKLTLCLSNRQYNGNRPHNSQSHWDQGSYQPNHGQRKLMCYYCEGEHCMRDCKIFTKDKAKYKLKTVDLAKKDKDKFRQATRKGNITVSEVSSVPESTYSVEQGEQLLGNLRFSDRESDSLDAGIKEVTADEASLGNVILYKVRVNNIQVDALYDTGVSISVMAKIFYGRLQNRPK